MKLFLAALIIVAVVFFVSMLISIYTFKKDVDELYDAFNKKMDAIEETEAKVDLCSNMLKTLEHRTRKQAPKKNKKPELLHD